MAYLYSAQETGLSVMCEMEYVSERWRKTLSHNQADNFEALWQLQKDNWFEAPNHRRGGWSGVCKAMLTLPEGGEVGVFIKRQENHFYRSWRHFFRQRPTFEREFHNILDFQKYDIPTVNLLYYGHRVVQGKLRAILITRELSGFQPLGDDDSLLITKLNLAGRKRIFESIAGSMRKMHENRFQHSCLYPKHIFLKNQADAPVESDFIDLEKARRRFFKKSASMKDLGILHRHTAHCSRTDRLRFFMAYRQEQRLSVTSKKMLAIITRPKKSQIPEPVEPIGPVRSIHNLQDAI
ncbi:MAG: lipopolysaccharide kinase InaA family protein [Nitrosomonadales bacterium]|nr:lipopolysaccharide kinase InaA family protein [Nitrosomonadales bacterium]